MPNNRRIAARLIAAAWLVLWLSPWRMAAATPHYSVDVWATDKGLPQSTVTSVIQTHDGYLWLGTLGGLVRFDGVQFKVFDENTTPGLNSSRIGHLFEDSRSNLWVGTQTAGISLVKDGVVTNLDIGRGSREGRLAATCEDAAGSVWLCTANGQLCRYREGNLDRWRIEMGPNNNWVGLVPDSSGLLWFGTERVLVAFRPSLLLSTNSAFPLEQVADVHKLDLIVGRREGGQWRLADGRVERWTAAGVKEDWGPYPWANAIVRAACEDSGGNLIVGTYGAGVFWFDAPGHASCISTKEGLSNNYVLALAMDREGSLWVGTDGGGLDRVKRQFFEPLAASVGLTVRSVCEDVEGGLWFSSEGDGLDYWRNGVLMHPGTPEGRMGTTNFVRGVLADRDDSIWVGTDHSGLFHLEADGILRRVLDVTRQIAALYQDRNGLLWAGIQGDLKCWDGNAWRSFRESSDLSQENVRAIADDAQGNIWLGTERGGLKRLNPKDGGVIAVQPPDGPPIRNVSALYEDGDGVLWIGTAGRGLARLQSGEWKRFTKAEGLISDSITYLIEDAEGYLWIGSNAGLMRVKKQALNDFVGGSIACRTYGRQDGLPTTESAGDTQPAACRGRDGRLYFPTIDGLASVDPAKLTPNTNPPPVVIESAQVDQQEQWTNGVSAHTPESVTVPAGAEQLVIDYSSLALAAPEKGRFKYRLEGHESRWTEVGSGTRTAIYTKLPHGQYRFQVKACNEDGYWNETGATISVIVLPPFWQTWWFLTGVTVFLLGMIVFAVHYISTQRLQSQLADMRQQQALETERARIARDIHDQVGASLTQVSLLGEMVESDKDLPAEVESHARQISQTARETSRALDEIVWTVNPSNDTLDGLFTYICKYAQEYLAVAGIRYRLDVPAQLPATAITPEVRHNVFLAAKESVTNIVKHARASEALIRLRPGPGSFILDIQDNGRGPAGSQAAAAQSRNGLRNMRKRMEDVGGSFEIGPSPEGGTVVRLTVPVAKS
jgi:ligand-binding sensor domain-containing protein/signal transduction histidine kinase